MARLCKDCFHFERKCRWLIGVTGDEDHCDWIPSRWHEKLPAEAGESEGGT